MKKITFFLFALLLLAPVFQNPTKAEALSCLPSKQKIGVVEKKPTELLYGGWYQVYTLGDVVNPPKQDLTLNTLEQQKSALNSYLSGSLDTYAQKPAAEDSFYIENGSVIIPSVYEDKIKIGDYIVSGGDQSKASCEENSLTTLFDGETKKPKGFVYYVVPKGNYEVNGVSIDLIGLDAYDDGNGAATFRINNNVFDLQPIHPHNPNRKPDIDYDINVNGLNILYLLEIYTQDQENGDNNSWVDYKGASFAITFDRSSINNDVCDINYSRLIKYGRVGEDVRQTQQCLNNLGYNTGVADGIYGPNTYRGISEFQTSQNIKVDGIVGPQTISYLNKF